MNPCPHSIEAWRCTNYAHYIYSGAICQDDRKDELNTLEDDVFCGTSANDCKGYKIDKRFKRSG